MWHRWYQKGIQREWDYVREKKKTDRNEGLSDHGPFVDTFLWLPLQRKRAASQVPCPGGHACRQGGEQTLWVHRPPQI